MSSKRKHSEIEPDVVHESRRGQVPGAIKKHKPASKVRKSEPSTYKKQAHASSVNAIKKRIRDVSRRLERSEELPANVRIEDERALEAYHQELIAAEAEKKKQKMINKYHMVRFFERQKATRQLKKTRKRLLEAEATEEVEKLKSEMHLADVDLNYTLYYPFNEPYISLFKDKNLSAGDEGLSGVCIGPRPAMWTEVEKCMEDGTLDRLRNRAAAKAPNIILRTPREIQGGATKETKSVIVPETGEPLNRRQRRARERGLGNGKLRKPLVLYPPNKKEEAEQQDDGSDGGFFED